MSKLSIIGAGQIGGCIAMNCIHDNSFEYVSLIDLDPGIAIGKSLDLSQSSILSCSDCKIVGGDDFSLIQDSDVIIVTAGVPRKPGMQRSDLININCKIVENVGSKIKEFAPNSFVIVITNPLDLMVHSMQKIIGFDDRKIIGMAGALDTSRFGMFLAEEFNCSRSDIHSYVIGSHDNNMVPLINSTTVQGVSLDNLINRGVISKERINEIRNRARNGGAEIVGHLRTGSAFFAPAMCAYKMARSYKKNLRQIFCSSVKLNGEYGFNDIYLGVPAVIGKNGVEKIIELQLSEEEHNQLKFSHDTLHDAISQLSI